MKVNFLLTILPLNNGKTCAIEQASVFTGFCKNLFTIAQMIFN